MSIRILITPEAIKAKSPCESRWKVYRTTTAPGPMDQPHPLARLARDGADPFDLLWVLNNLPPNPIVSDVRGEIFREWVASAHPGDCVRRGALVNPGSLYAFICRGCVPSDWALLARKAIRRVEMLEAGRRFPAR